MFTTYAIWNFFRMSSLNSILILVSPYLENGDIYRGGGGGCMLVSLVNTMLISFHRFSRPHSAILISVRLNFENSDPWGKGGAEVEKTQKIWMPFLGFSGSLSSVYQIDPNLKIVVRIMVRFVFFSQSDWTTTFLRVFGVSARKT